MQFGQGLKVGSASSPKMRSWGTQHSRPAHPRPAHPSAARPAPLLICRRRLRFAATCCPIISTIISG